MSTNTQQQTSPRLNSLTFSPFTIVTNEIINETTLLENLSESHSIHSPITMREATNIIMATTFLEKTTIYKLVKLVKFANQQTLAHQIMNELCYELILKFMKLNNLTDKNITTRDSACSSKGFSETFRNSLSLLKKQCKESEVSNILLTKALNANKSWTASITLNQPDNSDLLILAYLLAGACNNNIAKFVKNLALHAVHLPESSVTGISHVDIRLALVDKLEQYNAI